ncbi:MAG: helix-hairpin-helix domain-containing protein [Candidatus Promineifilaceae bacterium]
MWIYLIIGLAIGWILHTLAHEFFWRNRRICTDLELSLQKSVDDLKIHNGTLNGQVNDLNLKAARIPDLETDIQSREARIGKLSGDLDARNTQLKNLNDSIQTKNTEIGRFNAKLGTLQAENKGFSGRIGSLESELSGRNAELEDLNVQIDGLRAKLGERDTTIGNLRGQVGKVDSQLKGWGFGALAGGGLMALRERFSGMRADIDAKDTEIGNLQLSAEGGNIELERLSGDLQAKDIELGNLNADIEMKEARLDQLNARLGRLNANIDAKDSELGNLNAQIGSLHAGIATRDSEIEGLHLQLNEVNKELEGIDIDAGDAIAGAGAGFGLAGLVGWLRNRNQSLETDVDSRQSQLMALNAKYEADIEAAKVDTSGYNLRIGELEAALQARDAQINGLNVELGDLNASAEAKGSELGDLNLQLGNLNAELEARDSRIVRLEGEVTGAIENAEMAELYAAEVDTLRADVSTRDAELESLRLQLAEVNNELDGINIDVGDAAAGAGAGLGLAGMIGWLRNRTGSLETDVADRDSQLLALNSKYETDLEAAKVDTSGYDLQIGNLEAKVAERDVIIAGLRANIAPDNLTKVWGIGPKIEAALHQGGVTTYAQLAALDDDEITAMLDSSGVNYRLAGPEVRETWQEQAELLANGDKEELKLRQAQFKRSGGGGLGKVWGIGSKVTHLLSDVGVNNYTQLATSSTADIDEALNAAKGYYPNMTKSEIHQSWVEQASMASNGQWGLLKGYKARFRRGRQHDDLKRIWGIGPKTEKVLNSNDIDTFAELADASIERIEEILTKAGTQFNMSSDTLHVNWKRQARLAAIGDWDAFQKLYDELTWENQQDDA